MHQFSSIYEAIQLNNSKISFLVITQRALGINQKTKTKIADLTFLIK